jgi:hypothetical protein
MFFTAMIIPLIMAFCAFRGESLVPLVYENLGYSTVFVVAILWDILQKRSLEEEIEQNKKINNKG